MHDESTMRAKICPLSPREREREREEKRGGGERERGMPIVIVGS